MSETPCCRLPNIGPSERRETETDSVSDAFNDYYVSYVLLGSRNESR